MEKIAKTYDQHKGKWSLKTYQSHFCRKLTDWNYIYRCVEYYKNNGNRIHHIRKIENHLYSMFKSRRDDFLTVTTNDLMRWALIFHKNENKTNPNNKFEFRACQSWIQNFKNKYNISTRKITKLISKKYISDFHLIEQSIYQFKNKFIMERMKLDES